MLLSSIGCIVEMLLPLLLTQVVGMLYRLSCRGESYKSIQSFRQCICFSGPDRVH